MKGNAKFAIVNIVLFFNFVSENPLLCFYIYTETFTDHLL